MAGQLEAIEADMLEREAAFSHLERERDSLQARLDGSPERNHGDAVKKVNKVFLWIKYTTKKSYYKRNVRERTHLSHLEPDCLQARLEGSPERSIGDIVKKVSRVMLEGIKNK